MFVCHCMSFLDMNHYKLVYCLCLKIYGEPLKKIVRLATRPRFLSQGEGLGWHG